MTYFAGFDVGGSHVSCGIFEEQSDDLVLLNQARISVHAEAPASAFLHNLQKVFEEVCRSGGSEAAQSRSPVQSQSPAQTPSSVETQSSAQTRSSEETQSPTQTRSSEETKNKPFSGFGLAMPGPFDYDRGVSHIHGVHKWDSLYGLDLKNSVCNYFAGRNLVSGREGIAAINDAEAFLKGVAHRYSFDGEFALALTLGTGLGSASFKNKTVHSGLPGVGYLYNTPFGSSTADDYFSTRWFLAEARRRNLPGADTLTGVRELGLRAERDELIRALFSDFGSNLARWLNGVVATQKPDRIVLGGSISRAWSLFEEAFAHTFAHDVSVESIADTSDYATLGAALHVLEQQQARAQQHAREQQHAAAQEIAGEQQSPHDQQIAAADRSLPPCTFTRFDSDQAFRKSASAVLPVRKPERTREGYDIYPSFEVEPGAVKEGYDSLAAYMVSMQSPLVILDGFPGTHWPSLVAQLNEAFVRQGHRTLWYFCEAGMKEQHEIEAMLHDYLGGDDPLFGRLYEGSLEDFYPNRAGVPIHPDRNAVSIVYGCGAALFAPHAPVIYVDVPKNEIQYRQRAGSVSVLGGRGPGDPGQMYKRSYFVDWPVCNRHKQKLLPRVAALVDGQRHDTITWATGLAVRRTFEHMAKTPFRVRPWFEPGVWGGRWMMQRFEGLPQDAPNLAWSFEIIAPENGVLLSSDDLLLELGFECLLGQEFANILGRHASQYGPYFPLRFDYLDTMQGGNLSLQCHPVTSYMQAEFGEPITQDETYYIVDCEPGAKVYLGFQDDIDPKRFAEALHRHELHGEAVDVPAFVRSFEARKHDMFLIPAGTIHCSGENSLVLEISNTPYIYTFKMYDWGRVDLNGNPRPLNRKRALENLNFERRGDRVERELISRPVRLEHRPELYELPTHPEHLFDVHRFEFSHEIEERTEGRFHVLNLVQGTAVEVHCGERVMVLQYAETLVIPAAAERYRLVNRGESPAKVVKAFMR